MRKFQGKFDKIILLDKFWIKFVGNFYWIIRNKIFTKFKFVEHLRKILKTLEYFLVKFELISSIEVKLASKKMEENENWEKLRNSKKIGERWENF